MADWWHCSIEVDYNGAAQANLSLSGQVGLGQLGTWHRVVFGSCIRSFFFIDRQAKGKVWIASHPWFLGLVWFYWLSPARDIWLFILDHRFFSRGWSFFGSNLLFSCFFVRSCNNKSRSVSRHSFWEGWTGAGVHIHSSSFTHARCGRTLSIIYTLHIYHYQIKDIYLHIPIRFYALLCVK